MKISSKNKYSKINEVFMDVRSLSHVVNFWEMNEAFQIYSEWIKANHPKDRIIEFITLTTSDSYSRLQENYAAIELNRLQEKLVYFDVEDEVSKAADENLTRLIELDNNGDPNGEANKYKLPYIVRRDYKRDLDEKKYARRVELLKQKIDSEHSVAADEILHFGIKREIGHGSQSTDSFNKLNKWIVLPKTTKVPKGVFRAIRYLYPWIQTEDEEIRASIDNDRIEINGNQFTKVAVQECSVEDLLDYLSRKDGLKESISARIGNVSGKNLETKDLYETFRNLIDERILWILDAIGTEKNNPLFSKSFREDITKMSIDVKLMSIDVKLNNPNLSANDRKKLINDREKLINDNSENNSDSPKENKKGSENVVDLFTILNESIYSTLEELVGAKGEKKDFADCLSMNFKHANDKYLKNLPKYIHMLLCIKEVLKDIGLDVVREAVQKLVAKDNKSKTENKKSYWEKFESDWPKTFEKTDINIERLNQILDNIDGISKKKKQKYFDFIYEQIRNQDINTVNVIGTVSAEDEYLDNNETIEDTVNGLVKALNQLFEKVTIDPKKKLSKKETKKIENLKIYLTYEVFKAIYVGYLLCKDEIIFEVYEKLMEKETKKNIFPEMLRDMVQNFRDEDKLPKPYLVAEKLQDGIFTNYKYGEGEKVYNSIK